MFIVLIIFTIRLHTRTFNIHEVGVWALYNALQFASSLLFLEGGVKEILCELESKMNEQLVSQDTRQSVDKKTLRDLDISIIKIQQ